MEKEAYRLNKEVMRLTILAVTRNIIGLYAEHGNFVHGTC